MKLSQKIKVAASSLALGLFLLLEAMVASPALHALIHPDAHEANHQCAVTLFSHGQVDASSTAIPLISVSTPLTIRQSLPMVVFVSIDLQLHSCRGPPDSSLLA